jgi:hypothetical protein
MLQLVKKALSLKNHLTKQPKTTIMKNNEFTTIGAKVTMNGKVGIVMKALPYKTVVDFVGDDRWTHLRHNQTDMSLLKAFVEVSDSSEGVAKPSYSEAVRKAVNVINAPRGFRCS